MRATAFLVLAVVAVTAGHAAAQAPGAPKITVPTSAYVRPERVYVLPVVWVPADKAGAATSPDGVKATANLSAHLRTAQEKYRWMLKNYVTNQMRGTFGLATWYDSDFSAHVYDPLFNTLQPLVVQSEKTYRSLPVLGRDQSILADILATTGCKLQSCPFVFVILIADSLDDKQGIGAVPFNYGFNGGSGYVRIPISAARDATASTSTLLSTLLHELGHAFGLAHLADVYTGPGVDHLVPLMCRPMWDVMQGGDPGNNDPYDDGMYCPLAEFETWCGAMPWARRRMEFWCSPSVMSYAPFNQTSGCVVGGNFGPCGMPTSEQIFWNVPGILLGENLHNLAKNELVFPELAADFDLLVDDEDGDGVVQWHPGFAYPDVGSHVVPDHPQLYVTSPHSDAEQGASARLSFGHHDRPIAARHESFHPWRHWHSIAVGAGNDVHLDFHFPDYVKLGRVRVFTGNDGGYNRASRVMVRQGPIGGVTTECAGADLETTGDGEVQLYSSCPASRLHRVVLRAGDGGAVTVRGIRFFDLAGNEIQGPRGVVATSTSGHTGAYATAPGNVVGEEQVILSPASGFDGDRMWHSKWLGNGGIATFDIRLPELQTLSKLYVYTGHTSTYHRASRIKVWARDEDGQYVLLVDKAAGASTGVFLSAPRKVTHLRLELYAGTTEYVVLRGIRFWAPEGELYIPRSTYAGIYPLM